MTPPKMQEAGAEESMETSPRTRRPRGLRPGGGARASPQGRKPRRNEGCSSRHHEVRQGQHGRLEGRLVTTQRPAAACGERAGRGVGSRALAGLHDAVNSLANAGVVSGLEAAAHGLGAFAVHGIMKSQGSMEGSGAARNEPNAPPRTFTTCGAGRWVVAPQA